MKHRFVGARIAPIGRQVRKQVVQGSGQQGLCNPGLCLPRDVDLYPGHLRCIFYRYKTGWDPAESLRKMAEWSKGHFDPAVFQAFVKSMGIYPVGSLVLMKSGRIGVVTEQAGKSLTTPKVKMFYSTKSSLRIPAMMVDLSRADTVDRIAGREDPAKWRFPDLHELWSGIEGLGR